ncbi:MAG TPA: Hsp20/alpha crystallin family protein [Candidatus Paceibacterota bacterium]|nr:Hsp20/alpha crystallin family protein [Candidatus Paceibacterota bacterium]
MAPRDKKSFFERLTGTISVDAEEGLEEEVVATNVSRDSRPSSQWIEEESGVGQLAVDVYQTAENIFIKAMVAGVRPEDIDVSITRDMVTLTGRREEGRTVSDEDYFLKELYWGEFSRTILLPAEIEAEEAEAIEKNGLLIIRLPKIDKGKSTKLKIKTS